MALIINLILAESYELMESRKRYILYRLYTM